LKKNNSKITVPFLSKADIESKVQEFCRHYGIDRTVVPLDVEVIVEADLKLRLEPEKGVTRASGADALLLSNREAIIVDYDRFMKESFQNRLRFTIAHEIGHYILHEDVYRAVTFASVEEWAEFFDTIPRADYGWLEWQADEFAGRLLIEGGLLKEKFEEAKKKLAGTVYEKQDPLPEPVVEFMSEEIGRFFGVSYQPVIIRLQRENIWRPN
jgi:predicted Zn-dependent protease with MMP-like domain